MCTNATLGSLQHRWPNARVGLGACVCCVQIYKVKEGVGYVKSDENREVTRTRQNCKQP